MGHIRRERLSTGRLETEFTRINRQERALQVSRGVLSELSLQHFLTEDSTRNMSGQASARSPCPRKIANSYLDNALTAELLVSLMLRAVFLWKEDLPVVSS
jgi:hypothetical protein